MSLGFALSEGGYRLMKKENAVRGEDCIRDAAAAV
jgi:hypothetical protein